ARRRGENSHAGRPALRCGVWPGVHRPCRRRAGRRPGGRSPPGRCGRIKRGPRRGPRRPGETESGALVVPVVAIVGRPNVGKSSLFNWLAGRRIAIVDPTAGVTRDRVSTLVKADGRFFELVDTGGMGLADVDNLTDQVERQIE